MNTVFRCCERITVELPEKEIFYRLGGHAGENPGKKCFEQQMRGCVMKAYSLCEPSGRYCVLPVSEVRKDGILLSCGYFLESARFAALCPGIRALWCAAGTVGKQIVAARDCLENVSERAVYDAVGSECADAVMDFLQKMTAKELLRTGLQLSERRFSPGYGDMKLSVQSWIYNTLRMPEMGISLSGRYFMTPEKTVTAFAGITPIQER